MPENRLDLDALHASLVAAAAEEKFVIDEQAIRVLDAGLTEALLYLDVVFAESADRDRVSAHQALHTVIRFLQAHDEWRDASRPLVLIESALLDLEHGYVAPMLRPRVVGGRPVSWHSMKLRGYAAGIMDGLMKHARMSRSKAAGWVSKKLVAAGHDVEPATVIDWRKRAQNHKANPELHQAYCTVLGKPDWSQPLACAEQLAANLIGLQPQKGG